MTKSRLKTILKKAIIQFALFTFLFLSASVTLISFGNTSYSSFSSFLVHQRENNKLKFNYGEVKSNNLEGYTNFYWHADDKPGSNLRENMFTFFKTLTDDEKSYVFSSEEQSTSADLLLYTTWDFENYHYNFDIVKNKNDYKFPGVLDSDLIGLSVYDKTKYKGKIVGIEKSTLYTLLVVDGVKRHLIPNIEKFIKDIDLDSKKIYINYIKGLDNEN